MRHKIIAVEVIRTGSAVTLRGLGRTAKGLKFIAKEAALPPAEKDKQKFKDALATEVTKLLAEDV